MNHLTLVGPDPDISGEGNELPNVIVGNAGQNSIFGFAGDDHLDGGDGHDHLEGGEGSDTMLGGAGRDGFGSQQRAAGIRSTAAATSIPFQWM